MIQQLSSIPNTPPAFKVPVSTLVDSTRRLFRHSVWYHPDSACPGWLHLTFEPGWLGNTASGRVCYVRHMTCLEGELHQTIERVQVEHGVHLWLRPIKVPTTWPRGNHWWPEVACAGLPLDAAKVRECLKAVAA
ncbi:hypothetical protein Dcar01_03679 [Deinococcus carri]|uniref:Uncharacterized protein n=1 Tax=Deinococcus carri TaxID=1211323 RepID=A0ABP9WDW3_9DEIO